MTDTHQESLNKLNDLIQEIGTGMLVTRDEQGQLRSRPMQVANEKLEDALYFFSDPNSAKIHELETNPQVNVSFACPDKQTYISISGSIHFIEDDAAKQKLWKDEFDRWCPKDLHAEDLVLIQVQMSQAEYWDVETSSMVQLFGKAKSYMTGEDYTGAENKKLTI
ncbi:General stress protein [Planctomycetales bacterium 10988]|nr:General stress protein [Planctomycetales bacterium 10988]